MSAQTAELGIETPASIRVFRIDDWLTPGEVPGELARTLGAGTAREVVAMGRWSRARREFAAQLRPTA